MSGILNSPYLMKEPPTSTGRVLLARAFEHWCALHDGYSGRDIADAFDPDSAIDDGDRRRICLAARLLGELIGAEIINSSVRAIGGGKPEPLSATAWERDDFRKLFARSAINPDRPFDDDAEPTHWIFVDTNDFDTLVLRSLGQAEDDSVDPAAIDHAAHFIPVDAPSTCGQDDHVRMPELERRTGMSRATIYRRIAARRFPSSIPMDGNIAAWRERDVAEWLANPR